MAVVELKPMPGRAKRKGWTQEQSAIHGDLVYWGYHYRRILLSDGYSAFSPFAGLFEGRSGRFESKVLIPDMTPRAWRINHEVWALPSEYAWALAARYAAPDRDDEGRLYSALDYGIALGCSAETYWQRVSRGRKLLLQRAFS